MTLYGIQQDERPRNVQGYALRRKAGLVDSEASLPANFERLNGLWKRLAGLVDAQIACSKL